MKLGEFLEKFSHNNLIRLHYKVEGGHQQVLEDENDVTMDWEVNKGMGCYRHYIHNEVLSIQSILYLSGHYREAINIVIEKLDPQPQVEEIIKEKTNYETYGGNCD